MSLKTFAEETNELEWRGEIFTFRPLNIDDIVSALNREPEATEQALMTDVRSPEGVESITSLVDKMPDFALGLIATSTHRGTDDIGEMPVGFIVAALLKVIEVCEVDPEMLGKLLAMWTSFSEAIISLDPPPQPTPIVQ